MALMPVLTREMSVLARRRSTYWARAVTAVITVLIMMWLLLVGASRVPLASVGSSIFFLVSGLSFAFACLIGMQATADCLSEEKREGTLGLLFLTDLRAIHIVLGKMAASSLNAFFAVLGVVPMLSLAVLLGGVTLPEIGLMALVLVNSMFLSLAVGLFVSAVSENERKAMLACFLGMFVITFMPFVFNLGLTEFEKVYEGTVFISPLYLFLRVQDMATFTSKLFLVAGLISQHLLGWIFLFRAAQVLPRYVNPARKSRFPRIQQIIENYAFGKAEVRKRHRAVLLDRNAFLWLAGRERGKPKYAWTVVLFFGALFLWVALEFPEVLNDPVVPLIIIFLVHIILKLWTASEVCTRLMTDRQSGALELLLSSPLSVREIADGQGMALRKIFRWPVAMLVACEFWLLFSFWSFPRTEVNRDSIILFAAAITSLLLDLWALKWSGLWLSLFGKSIERALLATIGRVLVLPSVVFVVIGTTLGAVVALQNESVPARFMYFLFWALTTVFALGFALISRRNFLTHFREIAAQRFETAAKPEKRRTSPQRPRGSLVGAAMLAARRHWLVTGTGVLMLLLIGVPGGRRLYWHERLEVEKAALRAQKLPVSSADIGRIYPPVPASENAFAFLRSAGPVNGRWFPNNAAKWFDKPDEAAFAFCEEATSKNEPQLKVVSALSQFEKAYVDPLTDSGWGFLYQAGYMTIAAADLLLAERDRDHARLIARLDSLLRFVRLTRAQPVSSLQDNCGNYLTLLQGVLAHLLSTHSLTPHELLAIQNNLEKLPSQDILARTLAVRRAEVIEKWGHPDRAFGATPALVATAFNIFAAVGSSDQSLVRILENFRRAELNIALETRPALLRNMVGLDFTLPRLFTQAGYGPDPLSPLIMMDTTIEARLELLRAALAVERFQLEHHELPQSLETLVPQYLERAPFDPFTGKRFELQTDSFLAVRTSEEQLKPISNKGLIFPLARASGLTDRRESQSPELH